MERYLHRRIIRYIGRKLDKRIAGWMERMIANAGR